MESNGTKSFWLTYAVAAIIGILIGVVVLIADGIGKKATSDKFESLLNEETAEVEEAEVAEEVEIEEAGNGAFRATLSGPIAGAQMKAFEINYDPDATPNVTGRDSYNLSSYLDLNGNYDPNSGGLTLSEYDNGEETGSITGKLTIDRSSGEATYSGRFTNGKGNTYSFTFSGSVR